MNRPTRLGGDTGVALSFGRGGPRGDAGYVLAMTGLLIIPLIAMTAFAVDLGSWYAQAAKMQRSADAAALAGVVWTNDPLNPNKWDTVARETATKNGFTDGVDGVSVDVEKTSANRIRVTIGQDGEQYFSRLFVPDGQRLSRTASAEYVLPVPLGSPRNYIGTGGLGTGAVNTPYEPERLWAAVSGYCTDKTQGDRIAARYSNGASASNGCTGTQNGEFNDTNYSYYIELPAGRTYDTDVLVYNGNFNVTSGCGAPAAPQPNEFCPGGLNGLPRMSTTMTLYQADGTPLDDGDNPTMASAGACSTPSSPGFDDGTKSFAPGVLENNATFTPAGSFQNVPGWWRICRISSAAPPGRYIMRVRNQDATTGAPANTNGSNAFGIVATPATSQALCDARTNALCPKVYAKDFLSVYALANGTANFFLAEIGPEHAGKKVKITLWDSAEGATELRIKRPTGTNSWTDQTFSYTPTCSGSTGSTTSGVTRVYNGGSALPYNNCLLTIEFTLPTSYSPPADNEWWRIQYTYSSTATDRTTWGVEILGDPVHLVE